MYGRPTPFDRLVRALEQTPPRQREQAARRLVRRLTGGEARMAYKELMAQLPENAAGIAVLVGLDSPIHAALAERLKLRVAYSHMVLDIPVRYGPGRYVEQRQHDANERKGGDASDHDPVPLATLPLADLRGGGD